MLPLIAEGELDIMIGRVLERQRQFKDAVRYEPLADEPLCVVVRPGHPLEHEAGLTLRGLSTRAGFYILRAVFCAIAST